MLYGLAREQSYEPRPDSYVRLDKPSFLEERIMDGAFYTSSETDGEDQLLAHVRKTLKDRTPDHIIGTESFKSTITNYGDRLINIMQNGRTNDMPKPYHGELEWSSGPPDRPAGDSIKAGMDSWLKKAKYTHDLNKISDTLSDAHLVEAPLTARELREMREQYNDVGLKQRYEAMFDVAPNVVNELTHIGSRPVNNFRRPMAEMEFNDDQSIERIDVDQQLARGMADARTIRQKKKLIGVEMDARDDAFQSGMDRDGLRTVGGVATNVYSQHRTAMANSDLRENTMAGIMSAPSKRITTVYGNKTAGAHDTKFVETDGMQGTTSNRHGDMMSSVAGRRQRSAAGGDATHTFNAGFQDNTQMRSRTVDKSHSAVALAATADFIDSADLSNGQGRVSNRRIARTLTAAEKLAMQSIMGASNMTPGLSDNQLESSLASRFRDVTPGHRPTGELTANHAVGMERVYTYHSMVPTTTVNQVRIENRDFDSFMHDSEEMPYRKVHDGTNNNTYIIRQRTRDSVPTHDSTSLTKTVQSVITPFNYETRFNVDGDTALSALDGAEHARNPRPTPARGPRSLHMMSVDINSFDE